jgi:glycosyltransferase involved in cell wall biosynthesis
MRPVRLLAMVELPQFVTGPAKNLLEFARLAREGAGGRAVDTTLVVFRLPPGPRRLLDAAAASGIRVVSVSPWNRWDRKVLGELVALTRELQPDIVETHALLSHFVVRFAGLPRLAPWVAFHHGYTWPDVRTRLYNQADRWSLRAAARVVTNCQAFRHQLRRRGLPDGRIAVIHNAIDPQWGAKARNGAAELRARLGIPEDKKIILSVGRLSREKDHVTLVEALAHLRQQGAQAHLLIVGEGPERPKIEARARSLGLTEHVTLTGSAPAEPYFGVADVFALPSRSEGSANVLLEAMTTRVPVVATRVGGIVEMISDRETGLLVPPGDPRALASALHQLLHDPVLAETLTTQAGAVVRSRFNPEARATRIVELFGEVLNGQAGS